MDLKFAQNEFYDNNDYIGFISSEPDPYTFLTVDD